MNEALLWVVVGREVFDRVPKAAARRRMKNDGHVKHLEFRHNMSWQEVKDVLLRTFQSYTSSSPCL